MTSPDPDPSNRAANAVGSAADFSVRLDAARRQRGLDEPVATAGSPSAVGSALGIGVRVGVELLAALVVAVAIGWGLDRWLGTRPVFLALFVLLGGAAGVLNVWRLIGPMSGAPPR